MKFDVIGIYHVIIISRSREGAWIEIKGLPKVSAAMLSRSREGAWIEILFPLVKKELCRVAPARERGLKFNTVKEMKGSIRSLPRGSVD